MNNAMSVMARTFITFGALALGLITVPASAQAPKQLTVSKENSRSEVVSPDLIPNLRSTSSKISAAPRTWQAVPMHT